MDQIKFTSWEAKYKYPFGAIREGQPARFHFYIDSQIKPDKVELVVRNDPDTETERIPLIQSGADKEYAIYSCDYANQKAGLYFYRFEIFTGHGILVEGKGEKGRARIVDFLPEWQLTVYSKDFVTPDFIKGKLMYQIFPDRFKRADIEVAKQPKNSRKIHESWNDIPDGVDSEHYAAEDFFMGNLRGVGEKLLYLKELGVSMIYLNPVFESAANHRYNSGDYMNIDPYLGTDEDFKELCQKAEAVGIKIILDGVFSHTGEDSIYFNKYSHYNSLGAYNSEESPYYPWYRFEGSRDVYDCWWGVKSLPNVNETEESYLDFITGDGGVLQHWQSMGCGGWRLDVADELPDGFLESLRRRVKACDKDALIVGEVWEDASTKESYGERRQFLLGQQLDTVMNYPFRSAIIQLMKTADTSEFEDTIMSILENYPKPAVQTLMNSLSTHDTERILTVLALEDFESVPEESRREYILSNEDYEKGKALLKTAAIIQYTLPGVPCVYYGDEAGVYGFRDPYNRLTYPWSREDSDLLNFFHELGELRNRYGHIFAGDFRFLNIQDGWLEYKIGDKNDNLTVMINLGDRRDIRVENIVFLHRYEDGRLDKHGVCIYRSRL